MRVMDEVIRLNDRGVALLAVEWERKPYEGMRLRDARGKVHTVGRVSAQDGLYILHLPGSDGDDLERLFRDVRLDATLFEEADECPSA